MPRVLIVANRLPVTVKATDTGVEVERSSGGLATGLLRPHEQSGGLWVGWSGAPEGLTAGQRSEMDEQLSAMRLVAVPLTAEQVTRYYEGFSNGVLWPLFHYLLDQVPLHVRDWESYVEVNERFADAVAQHYQPDDLIWVHDYQLPFFRAFFDSGCPTPASDSSFTYRFPPKSCSALFPSARICFGACWAPISLASTLRHTSDTLPPR